MARQVQIIRGTTEQNNNFTGAIGAMTYVMDTKGLRVHDGSTQGGIEVPTAAMADYVIYWDSADATDHSHAKPGVSTPLNHGWYRYYKSGWVEQGGCGSSAASTAITFAIPMATSHYALSFGGNGASSNRNCFLLAGYNRTSTGFTLQAVVVNQNSQTSGTGTDSSTWICAGYAA